MKTTSLFYSDLKLGGTSNKQYHVQIVKKGSGYMVTYQNGPIGGTLQGGELTKVPVSLPEAEGIYDSKVREKIRNGYNGVEASIQMKGLADGLDYEEPFDAGERVLPAVIKGRPIKTGSVNSARAGLIPESDWDNAPARTRFPVELLEEISRNVAEMYVKSPVYWLQVKVDGHRRQMEKRPDGSIVSYNRKGEAGVWTPPQIENELKKLSAKSFLMDGEMVGNYFVAFDLLSANGVVITQMPYAERFDTLEKLLHRKGIYTMVVATWRTTKEKTAGLALLYGNRAEGAVFKRTDAPYRAGRNGVHKKYKFVKSATCKVIGLGHKGHNSATLAMRNGNGWEEVGRASLNGKDERIKIGSLVEVLFLYATEGKRLYQPRIKEVRTDVDESACSIDQLKNCFKMSVVVLRDKKAKT